LDLSMKKINHISLVLSLALEAHSVVPAQDATKDAVYYTVASTRKTEADEYTRYELLAPETASFKIYYEVTATSAGGPGFSLTRFAKAAWPAMRAFMTR
jgi:hypothetical protein